MDTTQSPFGLFTVMRFQAAVRVIGGQSYERAIYGERQSDAVLVANTRALIDAIAKLHKRARQFAGTRAVSWQTASGVKLPTDLQGLLGAIVMMGSQGPDWHEFTVEWTDSNQDATRILVELGDYFWFIDYARAGSPQGERVADRLNLALRMVSQHFVENPLTKKEK